MLIPYNTDAPIYHFPAATLGLIVGNAACFVATSAGSTHLDSFVLVFGSGIHPVQWVSSLFYHIGFVHLMGNMLFLWVFGLVVEGKVGWPRFLAIYFGMGVGQNALAQILFEFVSTSAVGAAGASGIIFGLMAMAMVWAPRNDIQCYVVIFLRIFDFSIAISTMCVLYLMVEVAIVAINSSFSVSAELLHLVGAAMGFATGCYLLKHELVDCENWDLFSLWEGKNKSTVGLEEQRYVEPAVAIKQLSESGSFNFTSKARKDASRIDDLIAEKKYGGALRELRQLQHLVPEHQLEEGFLGDLIRGLYRQKRWEDVTPLIDEFIQRFPESASSMHLRLSAILLEVQKRPKAALRAAGHVDVAKLRSKQVKELAKIKRAAAKLINSGHLELDR